MFETAARARAAFGDRTIWHVNATAHGGGVAEMLQTLLAYGRGAGIENRWLVLDGEPDFFVVTKRLHNRLHGHPGDGGALGAAEHASFERVLAANLADLVTRVARRDIVLLHDPQTAGMVEGLRAMGVRVVWRCHVGCDTSNDETDEAWAFLRRYVEGADAFVFSRAEYVPDWMDRDRVAVIPPSIDPFSAKNRDLDPTTVRAILATVGLVKDAAPLRPISFQRRDGSLGRIRSPARLVADGAPPPPQARLIVQVSRWDRLKDMAGVLTGFTRMAADGPADTHLVLAGPDVSRVTDDPEGAAVLTDCRERWRSLPEPVRSRVHLASVPMDDVDENAMIVNALQRQATMVVQKSLVEGFGLTVTEAMWKALSGDRQSRRRDPGPDRRRARRFAGRRSRRPRCTGGWDGPPPVRPRVRRQARPRRRERVQDQYLGDRHLAQYADLFERLSSSI